MNFHLPSRFIILWLLLPAALLRGGEIKVSVAPDRDDWLYKTGEPVRFIISVTDDGAPVKNAGINYTIGPEKMPAPAKKAVVPEGGLVVDGGSLAGPGFLRCVVNARVAGKTYKGIATAGVSPENIKPTQTEPEDFELYWKNNKAELAAIPMEAERTLLPEYCTGAVNVYHVRIRTLATGLMAHRYKARVYGIVCEPKAPGNYPAVLRVPGAGIARRVPVNTALAARGLITLGIGIHGIPVNLPKDVYEDLDAGALRDYRNLNLDNRDAYYYRRVYMGCVRANDYLVSLPNFDGKNLIVAGGSQGGMLAMVTAALDPRVTGLAAQFPAYCDVTGYLHGRAGGWPHMFAPDSARPGNPAKVETTAYYDVVNFAKRIAVPGHYAWGYNDETCPPTSIYAAYNQITAPKTLHVVPSAGHKTTPEQNAAIEEWITQTAKADSRP
ncbi:MAG: acetylxylan esterase [Opitutaceae bacterium]|jgi:cephalosporin-C deacetylase-like acetyl esterase|nr:acetylxylan esterase [Opitutaceae bacterium]